MAAPMRPRRASLRLDRVLGPPPTTCADRCWGPLVMGLLETMGGGYRRGLGPSLKLRATVTVCHRPLFPLSETTTNPAREPNDVFLGFSAAG